MDLHITQEWATSIGKVKIDFPENIRKDLIQCVATNYSKRINKKEPIPSFIDLFDYTQYTGNSDLKTSVHKFEDVISKVIKAYIKQAWGFDETVQIEAHCTSKVQLPYDKRLEPHRHTTVNGTLVHYLTVGNEFYLDDNKERESLNTDYSGDLILLDPRPNNICLETNARADIIKISPFTGLTVIHPGYVWHETNTHTQSGLRICLVVNFNVSKESQMHPTLTINLRPLL
tara:strand:- start:949 stop:1638 length:690 start_codon:yes stop_codon:yes gene_type:complete